MKSSQPSDLEIRPAEKFPEPAFSQLQRQVFADVQCDSDELDAVLRAEAAVQAAAPARAPPEVPKHASSELPRVDCPQCGFLMDSSSEDPFCPRCLLLANFETQQLGG